MKTFGSDPEFILEKDGRCRSAIGIVQGSIENRIDLHGFEFYYDNVLAECAIKYGRTQNEVIENFRLCFQIYSDMVKPYKLLPQASEIFPDEELAHKDSRRVGCAKEFCAYEMKQKESPLDEISGGNLRSCGGHIHLGADILAGDGPEPILAIYMMDLFLGVPSLWLDKDKTSPRRREIYGKAGRYRPKPYGIEYRSLGNFWLQSPDCVRLIYDISMFCISFIEKGSAWDLWEFDIERFLETDDMASAWKCLAYDANLLREGINQSNKQMVKDHYNLAKELLPKNLSFEIEKFANQDFNDFYENWGLRI
jgi:hypothetical protein